MLAKITTRQPPAPHGLNRHLRLNQSDYAAQKSRSAKKPRVQKNYLFWFLWHPKNLGCPLPTVPIQEASIPHCYRSPALRDVSTCPSPSRGKRSLNKAEDIIKEPCTEHQVAWHNEGGKKTTKHPLPPTWSVGSTSLLQCTEFIRGNLVFLQCEELGIPSHRAIRCP